MREKKSDPRSRKRAAALRTILLATALPAAALLLVPGGSGAGPGGWADSPEENGHWVRTAAAAAVEAVTPCPDGSRCVEWCQLENGQDAPTGEFCCLVDGSSTFDHSAVCLAPGQP